MDMLYIQTPRIGGELSIQHGFATMISTQSSGENYWISQQITIGYAGSGRSPVFGDNVTVICGG